VRATDATLARFNVRPTVEITRGDVRLSRTRAVLSSVICFALGAAAMAALILSVG
jgi:hypothetical protein